MWSVKLKISFKSIIILAIVAIFIFALSVKMGINALFFYSLIIVSFLCIDAILLIINFLILKGLKITRECQNKVLEDDTLSVKLLLWNKGLLPLGNMLISDSIDQSKDNKRFFLSWVSPNSKIEVGYYFICGIRGKHILGPVKLYYMGFFGFFRIEEVIGLEKEVYVYPKLFPIKSMFPLAKGCLPWFGIETESSSGDDNEFFGVREYKIGDPISKIHWLSVARKNMLIVKEFQKCNFYRVSIIYVLNIDEDLGIGKNKISEYTLRIAAALAKYFLEQNICVEMLAHTGELGYFPSGKGTSQLASILEFCALAKVESKIKLVEFIQEYSKFILASSTIFLLLTDKNIDAIIEILSLKEYNITIVALIFISSTFLSVSVEKENAEVLKKKIVEELVNVNVRVLFFSKGDNLEEVFMAI